MRIDQIIYSLCRQPPSVLEIVEDRVSPLRKGQKVPFPALVYRVDGISDGLNMSGFDGLRISSVEIASVGTTYTQARQLADNLRSFLHGYRGPVQGGGLALDFNFIDDIYSSDLTKVQGAWITDEEDLYDDDPKRFTILQTYKLYFCE